MGYSHNSHNSNFGHQGVSHIKKESGREPIVGEKMFVSVVVILSDTNDANGKRPQKKLGAFQTTVKKDIPFPQVIKDMVREALVKDGYTEPLSESMKKLGHHVHICCYPLEEWEDIPVDEWVDAKTLKEKGF